MIINHPNHSSSTDALFPDRPDTVTMLTDISYILCMNSDIMTSPGAQNRVQAIKKRGKL